MRSVCFIAVALVCGLASAVSAQPLADRIPADAIVYIGWQGTEGTGQAYEQSHMRALLQASRMSELLTKVLPQAAEMFADDPDDGGQLIFREFARMTSDVAGPMWNRPWAITFHGIEPGPRPKPMLTFWSEPGPQSGQVRQSLQRFIDSIGPAARHVQVEERDGLMTVHPGGALAPAGPMLAQEPSFASALARVSNNPAAILYVNVQKVADLVRTQMPANNQDSFNDTWTSLGMNGLRQIICTGSFQNGSWLTQTFIDAPTPRSGVPALFDGAPINDEAYALVPSTAVMVGTGRFDPAALLERVRATGEQVSPDFGRRVTDTLQMVNSLLAVNVENDVLKPLGDVWTAYVDPALGGTNVLGMVFINKLDDPAAAERGLIKFQQSIANLATNQMDDPRMSLRIRQHKDGELTVHFVGVPIVSPAWAIHDGHLYAGLYPQTVVSAIKGKRQGTILDNPKFRAFRDRLGAAQQGSLWYVDMPALVPQNYPTWLLASRYAGFADLFKIDIPAMMMPPMHELVAHLEPGGAISWSDDAGWYSKSITPFPGAAMLSGDPSSMGSVGAVAVTTSILLPSLNRARETANRVKCASNLRMMGQATLLYGTNHQNAYPPDQGTMLDQVDLVPEMFICPSASEADAGSGIPREEWSAWANEHSHYVYLGAGMKLTETDAATVIAYDRPQNHDDEGINVLFGDGHVSWLNLNDAREIILAQNPDAPGFDGAGDDVEWDEPAGEREPDDAGDTRAR